jgi:hypothetical protein
MFFYIEDGGRSNLKVRAGIRGVLIAQSSLKKLHRMEGVMLG